MGMRTLILVAILALSGCASSTGVVPTGPDSYMVTREGGSAFVGTNGLKADAYREASDYCAKNGKTIEVVSTQEQSGGFMRYPHAEVNFMCLSPGDRDYGHTKLVPISTH